MIYDASLQFFFSPVFFFFFFFFWGGGGGGDGAEGGSKGSLYLGCGGSFKKVNLEL